jgi:hypothetical protein
MKLRSVIKKRSGLQERGLANMFYKKGVIVVGKKVKDIYYFLKQKTNSNFSKKLKSTI